MFMLLPLFCFTQKVGDSIQIISQGNREYNGLVIKIEDKGYFIKTDYSSSIYMRKTEIKSFKLTKGDGISSPKNVLDEVVGFKMENKDFIKILNSVKRGDRLRLSIHNNLPEVYRFKRYKTVRTNTNKKEFILFMEEESGGWSRSFESKNITTIERVTKTQQ
jgi:hypothetical protein